MSYPPPPGGWQDPPAPGQQSSPPADPTLPMSGSPIPSQPTSSDPYAGTQPSAAPAAGPYTAPGYPPAGDPYAAPGYPPPAYPVPGYPVYGAPPTSTNSMAVVALVLALVGVFCGATAPIGAILGHVASKQIRETGEQGEGLAKAAIIVGWILTGLMVLGIACYVALIIFAIAAGGAASGSTPTF
ncbi:DUF4190 domain-containing protein [Micromonospora sp. NPDC048999]|uniref:DUF4190 domain-containing protein n=1 Tax=Micromonospora sp. NPDC048999 TaxID=3155391 RepID=UPI0033CDF11A